MRVLVVSPVPSHPQDQGNSSRIFTLCRSLQAQGHLVHFLYYTLEGLNQPQADAMAQQWDAFHALPCTAGRRAAPGPHGYALDDWYDAELGQCAAALHRHWQFDAVLVNYVWMSAVLDALPPGPLKLIDTHDVFGDRQAVFAAAGVPPAWFFTTRDEERRGLCRADAVLAIQDEEARHFTRELQGQRVRVQAVGHLAAPRFLPPRHGGGPLRVGYLASGNPLNVKALGLFMAACLERPEAMAAFETRVAGAVGARLALAPGFRGRWLGVVNDLDEFYAGIDVAVNPMPAGTGLKIKTLEALAHGRPVVGTPVAWVGLDGVPPPLAAAPAQLPERLAALAEPGALQQAGEACRGLFVRYHAAQWQALERLFSPPPTR